MASSDSEKSRAPALLLALAIGAGGGWLALRTWERKMKRAVSGLVKVRLQKIQEGANFEGRIAEYQAEINRLKQHVQDVRTGYEHQIDLLNAAAEKSKGEVQALHTDMDEKLEQMRVAYLEFEDLRKEFHRLEEERTKSNEEHLRKLQHKDSLITEYQRTISEQRMILEKKQGYIGKLEGKVSDLMYEIRSLLQLEDASSSATPPVDLSSQAMVDYYIPKPKTSTPAPLDLSLQLQKFIDKAEHLTGAEHLGGRFGIENLAIDQRRLYDQLRDETAGMIFIYSPADKKFVFVNNAVKTLLGWGSDTFMKDFPRLVTGGYPAWKEALSSAIAMKGGSSQVTLQSKAGKQIRFSCGMGGVSKGPFGSYVIGLFTVSE